MYASSFRIKIIPNPTIPASLISHKLIATIVYLYVCEFTQLGYFKHG